MINLLMIKMPAYNSNLPPYKNKYTNVTSNYSILPTSTLKPNEAKPYERDP